MNINLQGQISSLGYGVVTANILKELDSLGHAVAFFPMFRASLEVEERFHDVVNRSIRNAGMFDYHAPSVRIWHQFSMAESIGRGKRVGFPIFELDNFNDIEKHHLKSLDVIVVCSQWAKNVVENVIGNEIPVHVAPLGVDMSIFSNSGHTNHDKVTFINVGKWEIRKGHDILVQAFNNAFSEDDNVELLMMCDNPFLPHDENEKWKNYYKRSKLGNKIRFCGKVKTQEQLAMIYSHVDCGIFPTKAEGWCLPALELMACGKHVIITDYSGQTEFCNSDNSYLVEVESMEDAHDGIWFSGQGRWCVPSFDSLVNRMREAYQDIIGGKRVNKEGIKTAERFSWLNTAIKLVEAIQ